VRGLQNLPIVIEPTPGPGWSRVRVAAHTVQP